MSCLIPVPVIRILEPRLHSPVPLDEAGPHINSHIRTQACWHRKVPSYCSFQYWCYNRVLRAVLTDLANTLRDGCALDESQCFNGATFASTKVGSDEIGTSKFRMELKIMAIVDCHGLPLDVSTHAANYQTVILMQLSFDFYMIEAKPENMIGDRAYVSDRLDNESR